MPLTITYLGHSGFLFDDGECRVVVDPFLTGNSLAKSSPQDIDCRYIALTHGHADHFGDTLAIATRNDATVIAAYEICEYCGEHNVDNVEPGNTGGTIATDFGSVSFTQAFHSSSYNGVYMGQPCGLVLRFDKPGVSVYHAGDTALFSDMKHIGELYKPDIALLPAGDRFTMGPAHAAKAAELIQPRVAVPIHHSTFPLLTSDLSAFKPQGIETRILKPGEVWQFA